MITKILTALHESYVKVEIFIDEDIEVHLDGKFGGFPIKGDGFVACPDNLEQGMLDALDAAISGLPKGWRAE